MSTHRCLDSVEQTLALLPLALASPSLFCASLSLTRRPSGLRLSFTVVERFLVDSRYRHATAPAPQQALNLVPVHCSELLRGLWHIFLAMVLFYTLAPSPYVLPPRSWRPADSLRTKVRVCLYETLHANERINSSAAITSCLGRS